MLISFGATEEELVAGLELQRDLLREHRAGALAQVRAWLERGGETLQ
jgi:hypothetical protein